MIDRQAATPLLAPDAAPSDAAQEALRSLGFENPIAGLDRFRSLCETQSQQETLQNTLPALLHALAEAASADLSLLNFQRFVLSVPDRDGLFATLSRQPRAVEILVKLFVGSQFLTEILLKNPHYLERLTQHKRLAEFKSRQNFLDQGRQRISGEVPLDDFVHLLCGHQQWETLRLAACDTFGLMDLKTVTLQLSLLADAIIQLTLEQSAKSQEIDADELVVLALGKLGGEELNYSSDVDLMFVCERDAERYWRVAQTTIRLLSEANAAGFLYRVDLRLRPWGAAGPLVTTADAYVDYIRQHGRAGKSRPCSRRGPIAGNLRLGDRLLARLEPLVYDVNQEEARRNVLEMKHKIEQYLVRKGHRWGEVKGGPGGIRDIEFLTQFLQLTKGRDVPAVRSRNTLDSLVRLAERELLYADEYRRLSEAYVSLRTIEHALQLMHNQQEHLLPGAPRGLAYLARRLDFPDAETFVRHYEQHTQSVREIFDRRLAEEPWSRGLANGGGTRSGLLRGLASETFDECPPPQESDRLLELAEEMGGERGALCLESPGRRTIPRPDRRYGAARRLVRRMWTVVRLGVRHRIG